MSKLPMFAAVALCASFGIASADDYHLHSQLVGHPNLVGAEKQLFAAFDAISRSQTANECVFKDEGGHGANAKRDVEAARKQVYDAAEWVNAHAKDCERFHASPNAKGEPRLRNHPALKGHPNLIEAEKDLIDSYEFITRSQAANECVFGLEGGHGAAAKEAIRKAYQQVYDAAEWVNTKPKVCYK